MGEQPPAPSPGPANSSTVPQSQTKTDTTDASSKTSTDVANVPTEDSYFLSKLPLRPRKIRKPSPDESNPSSGQPNSSAKTRLSQQRVDCFVVPRSLSCDGELEAAIGHLRDADPVLATLIDTHPPPSFEYCLPPFVALTRSIIQQQLAHKAGISIYTRLTAMCGGEAGVVPETILALTPQQLRQIGVSERKASYLHDLARKYQNGILSDAAILSMDDKSLSTMLTMVNGIGLWSVLVFMIFSLHRPDVLPTNDPAIRKGVKVLYNLEELPRSSQMDKLCEKWRPYRSLAAWYLWKYAEANGTPSSAVALAAGIGLPPLQQEEQQPQLLDPINSILNLRALKEKSQTIRDMEGLYLGTLIGDQKQKVRLFFSRSTDQLVWVNCSCEASL